MTPLPDPPPSQPSPGPYHLWRNPWYAAAMSVGLLIIVAVGVTTGSWLAALTRIKMPGLWKPNTGQLESHVPQTLTLLDPGRVTVLPIVSPSTKLPEIEMIVNGHAARFMVDTGSSHVWVLSNALEKLGLRAEAQFNAEHYTWEGRGYSKVAYVKAAVPFALGNGTLLQVENILVLPADTEISYAGLVSGSFLEAIGGSLDFRDRTLRIDGPLARPAVKSGEASPAGQPGKS